MSLCFEGTNTLVILNDCAALKDVKGGTGQLMFAQKMTRVTTTFRENVAAIVLFYTTSTKTTKADFEDNAGELTQHE